MYVGFFRDLTPPRGALDKAFLDQERLIDFLEGAGLLANGSGNSGDAHRAALEVFDDHLQDAVVHLIQPIFVHVKGFEAELGDFQVDRAIAHYLRKVPHPAQQAIGDTGRAAGPAGYFPRSVGRDFAAQQPGRAPDDLLQGIRRVVLQPGFNAEAGQQRGRQQAGTGGGAYQGKRQQVQLDGPRAGPGVNHDIDPEVLHGGIQVLLHDGAEPVDFINKQYIPLFQVGQQPGKVPRLFDHRPRSFLDIHTQLIGHDAGQRGFSQTRGAMEQHMIQCLPAQLGRFYEYLQIGDDLVLPGEINDLLRAYIIFELLLSGAEPVLIWS